MSEYPEQSGVVSEICVLYELVLAMGDSLDLQKTCDAFVRTLMSRKSFSVASIWLRRELLPQYREGVEEGPGLVLLSGAPQVQLRQRHIGYDHVIWKQLQKRGAFSIGPEDELFAALIIEKRITGGVVALFPLGSLGLLKVYANNRICPLDEVELAQISTVLRKLAASLQGCIDHETLLQEVASRKQAERERQALADQMQQALRMETVGRLASGIAHDFNNLLVAVMGHAEILLMENPGNSAQQESLECILTAGRRGAGLTKQLLAFSRREPAQDIVLRPEALFLEVAALLSPRLTQWTRIETDFRLGEAQVRGAPAELSALLLNLGVNGLDAMAEGGVLRLVAGRTSSDKVPFAEVARSTLAVDWCELSVEDTGIGVPKELQKHIFDPFFTTKSIGKGTGLGLATAYATAKQHGGHIAVESEDGLGAKFTLYLPLLSESGEALGGKVKEGRGCGRILLIDDDESARRTIAGMCRSLGWVVVEAEDGESGLELAKDSLVSFDVVIVDMRMPGINGVETVRRLKASNLGSRIIVSSGFANVEEMSAVSLLGVRGILQKPFQLSLLKKALHEASSDDPQTVG